MAGRIKIQLAKVLERDLGIVTRPDTLDSNPNRGTGTGQFRWECAPDKYTDRWFGSYDTMTDCARKGVVWASDCEVYAK